MTAIEVLQTYQKQCDPEGVEVQVSRQALDEVLRDYERLTEALRIAVDDARLLTIHNKQLTGAILAVEADRQTFIPYTVRVRLDKALAAVDKPSEHGIRHITKGDVRDELGIDKGDT
jgi:hypothetical protein